MKRYTRPEDATPETGIAPRRCGKHRIRSLPDWLHTPAAPEHTVDRRLRPSDPAAGRQPAASAPANRSQLRARALQRGTLVHRLLQSLPDVADRAPPRRGADDISPAMPTAGPRPSARRWRKRVLALIADQRFAPVFARGQPRRGADRRPAGAAGRPPALVSGQIDRLVVTPAEVLIVDYKTNHAPPARPAEAPAGLCPPARALPGGAAEALSPAAGPGRAALDRNA